jgi:NTP pyrophosphatase (non-canonical NTP hydrolase)
MTTQEKEILLKAWNTFGEDAQLDMLVEECAELIQAVNKYKRAKVKGGIINTDNAKNHLSEEITDVENMLYQVKMGLALADNIWSWRHMKIGRLRVRVEEIRNKNLEN